MAGDGKPRGWVGVVAPFLARRGQAKLRKAAAKFLEPGEQLLQAVPGRTRPLKAIGSRFEAAQSGRALVSGEDSPRVVLRTDRWIRVLHTSAASMWKPKEELKRFGLDEPVTCELWDDRSGGLLTVGLHEVYFGPYAVGDAEAMATEVAGA